MTNISNQQPRSNKHGRKRPYTELVTVDLGLDHLIIKALLNLLNIQYINQECRTKSITIILDLADRITAYLLNHYDGTRRSSINSTTTDPLKNPLQRLQDVASRFEFNNQPVSDLYKHLNDIYNPLNHDESLYLLSVETQLHSIILVPGRTSTVVNDRIRRNTTFYM